jgi:hypothetical protein
MELRFLGEKDEIGADLAPQCVLTVRIPNKAEPKTQHIAVKVD